MDSKNFVAGLVEEMKELFGQLEPSETLVSESDGRLGVVTLLKLALTSEIEASNIAALWLPTTPEISAKTLFAEQCADEMRHYNLIVKRLEALGEDMTDFDPFAEGYSPLYQYLRTLRGTVERVCAGPFTCEAVAEVRNSQFIEYCHSVGDAETAGLYEKIIQPEEVHHHRLGRECLEKIATTPETQELARNAMLNSLAIADELKTLAEKSTGLSGIPVS